MAIKERRRFRWGVLRWRILAERSSDKAVASAQSSPRFGVETVAWPYSGWRAECLPNAFHPSQQTPTEPAWQRLSAGDGSKGPRLYDGARVRLNNAHSPEWERWLVARRTLPAPDDPRSSA